MRRLIVLLTALALLGVAPVTQAAEKLNHADVAAFVKKHNTALRNAQQFVVEIKGNGVQICNAETQDGQFDVTDALGKRVTKEATALTNYSAALKSFVASAKHTKVHKGQKAFDAAVANLGDVQESHIDEFGQWDQIAVTISSHNCGGFAAAIDAAKTASHNAWFLEQNDLEEIADSIAKSAGQKAPAAPASGQPYGAFG